MPSHNYRLCVFGAISFILRDALEAAFLASDGMSIETVERYVKETFLKPLAIVWAFVTGAVGLLAYFNLGEQWTFWDRGMLVALIGVGALLAYVVFASFRWFAGNRNSLGVRTVVEGQHYYDETPLLILDHGYWVEPDQIVTLFVKKDSALIPLSLMRVEGFTTENHPQAIIARQLSDESVLDYVRDGTRTQNLVVKPEIREGILNEKRKRRL